MAVTFINNPTIDTDFKRELHTPSSICAFLCLPVRPEGVVHRGGRDALASRLRRRMGSRGLFSPDTAAYVDQDFERRRVGGLTTEIIGISALGWMTSHSLTSSGGADSPSGRRMPRSARATAAMR